MKATATWKGGYETRLDDGRGHEVTVDLERDEGGRDAGTSSLELLVLSLAGCITTIFALVARRRRIPFDAMSVTLEAHRPRGARTLTAVDGAFTLTTTAGAEDVETALGITMRTCPVGVLFEQAGVPVHVSTRVQSPAAASRPVAPAAVPAGRPSHGHAHGGHHGSLVGRAWSREEAIAALESPERRRSQDPERLWDRLALAKGATVVEVGAGTGFFALPAARRVGENGRVYATDLSEELVSLLRERAGTERLPQLVAVHNTLERIPLDSASADLVLLANVLHDVPEATVSEAVRLLKPDGRLVNIDWKPEDTPGGPPTQVRLTPEEATRRLEAHGLRAVERFEFGPWHYGILFRVEAHP